ncbi:hypothetical protein ACFPK9_02045 [Rubritalea spongiae]|uniref:Uncharacterized protein n=1 Tax=Rubritalea spongiae TaxID=430797 RepID=A0ABW5E3D7_9BACT
MDYQRYTASYILHQMLRHGTRYDIIAADGSEDFLPILQWLLSKGYVEFDKSHHYTLSKKGKIKAEAFIRHYQSYLTYIDIFAHVDLAEGSFALSSYQDFDSELAWKRFLLEDRWEDMRIPIIKHLGGNPEELVFYQQVQEEQLDTDTAAWQTELISGEAWKEIRKICDSAIRAEQLTFEDNGSIITGETILDDIANQGFSLLRDLYSDDIEILSNLNAWFPQHATHNPSLKSPCSDQPIWQTPWTL